MKKRLVSSILAAGVIFNSSGVLAEIADIYVKKNLEKKYTSLEMLKDKEKSKEIHFNEDKYAYEGRDGKIYSLEHVNKVYRDTILKGKTFSEFLDELEKYPELNSDEDKDLLEKEAEEAVKEAKEAAKEDLVEEDNLSAAEEAVKEAEEAISKVKDEDKKAELEEELKEVKEKVEKAREEKNEAEGKYQELLDAVNGDEAKAKREALEEIYRLVTDDKIEVTIPVLAEFVSIQVMKDPYDSIYEVFKDLEKAIEAAKEDDKEEYSLEEILNLLNEKYNKGKTASEEALLDPVERLEELIEEIKKDELLEGIEIEFIKTGNAKYGKPVVKALVSTVKLTRGEEEAEGRVIFTVRPSKEEKPEQDEEAIKAAKDAVKEAKEAAEKDLVEEDNLSAAEEVVKEAEEAISKVKDEDKKAELEEELKEVKEKVEKAREEKNEAEGKYQELLDAVNGDEAKAKREALEEIYRLVTDDKIEVTIPVLAEFVSIQVMKDPYDSIYEVFKDLEKAIEAAKEDDKEEYSLEEVLNLLNGKYNKGKTASEDALLDPVERLEDLIEKIKKDELLEGIEIEFIKTGKAKEGKPVRNALVSTVKLTRGEEEVTGRVIFTVKPSKEDEKEKELEEAKEAKKKEIDEIELTDEEKEGKTEESIKKAEDKLNELKEAAKKEVDEAETVEEVNKVEVGKDQVLELLEDEKEKELEEAKEAKKKEIDEIELTDEEKEGKTEESIKKAEDKLNELKEAAKKEVDEAETVEDVNKVEVDKDEALGLLENEAVDKTKLKEALDNINDRLEKLDFKQNKPSGIDKKKTEIEENLKEAKNLLEDENVKQEEVDKEVENLNRVKELVTQLEKDNAEASIYKARHGMLLNEELEDILKQVKLEEVKGYIKGAFEDFESLSDGAKELLKVEKEKLEDLKNKLEKLENEAAEKAAEEAVKKAEKSELEEDINKAKELVDKLEDGEKKDNLSNILEKLQEKKETENKIDELIIKVQNAIKKAEKEHKIEEDGHKLNVKELEVAESLLENLNKALDGLGDESKNKHSEKFNELKKEIETIRSEKSYEVSIEIETDLDKSNIENNEYLFHGDMKLERISNDELKEDIYTWEKDKINSENNPYTNITLPTEEKGLFIIKIVLKPGKYSLYKTILGSPEGPNEFYVDEFNTEIVINL